jgi:ribosomal protein S18 acetylase RimI-like enzyme
LGDGDGLRGILTMETSKGQIIVRQATVDDLDSIVPMFDAYRQFYRQPPDLELARAFLLERFQHNQSIIFLALDLDGSPLGFAQLYPSFSSGLAKRIFVLNDLFVVPEGRRRKVGHLLLRAAAEFGRKVGAARLSLSTALDNAAAQALYESSGWRRDHVFCTYTLPLE